MTADSRTLCLPQTEVWGQRSSGGFSWFSHCSPFFGLTYREVSFSQSSPESRHRGNNRPTGSQVTQGTQVLAPLFHSSLASLVSPAEKEQCNNAKDSYCHLQGCNLEQCRKDKLQCCNLHRSSAVRMQKGHDKHSLKAVCHALTR